MDAALGVLVAAAFGVNLGWQPADENPQAYEVLVQLEPELVEALGAGRPVPIESDVPAGVNPIRRFRIVVGQGDLPRVAASRPDPAQRRTAGYGPEGTSPAGDRPLVRGQEPTWTDDRYPAAPSGQQRRYEQFDATIGSQAARSEPGSPLGRVENALSETGSTLKSGIEAGIEQANQELRELTGTAGAARRSTEPAWPAPPPSPVAGSTPRDQRAASTAASANRAASGQGWTSIRDDLAPPRLLIPALSSDGTRVADRSPAASGPSFPATVTSQTPIDRGPAPPSAARDGQPSPGESAASGSDWAAGWGSDPPAADQRARGDRAAGGDIAASPTSEENPWEVEDTVAPPPAEVGRTQPDLGSRPPGDRRSNVPTGDSQWDWPETRTSAADPPAATAPPPSERKSRAEPSLEADNAAGHEAPDRPLDFASSQRAETSRPPADDTPWLPLLGVSVGLVASLAANLFLGWSYADARHKYRTLVRKTTHAFQKKAGVVGR